MTDPGRREVAIRRATDADVPQILALAARSLGWRGSHDDEAFFRWKHFDNPFGKSPMWIALDEQRVVGLRAFLRWELRDGRQAPMQVVRAVDTATDPDYEGRGIFTRLTLHAIDDLRAAGVPLIFNTPNDKSLPGYLKMGWTEVGRLPVVVRIARPRAVWLLPGARGPATRTGVATDAGESPAVAFSDADALRRLLDVSDTDGIATVRTVPHLRWRYGHEPLGYRVVLRTSSLEEGLAVFRLRRRGRALEAVICEVLTPQPDPTAERSLVRAVVRAVSADYVLRLEDRLVTRDGFVRLPRVGPVLACRRLDGSTVPRLRDWRLTLGDVELF